MSRRVASTARSYMGISRWESRATRNTPAKTLAPTEAFCRDGNRQIDIGGKDG